MKISLSSLTMILHCSLRLSSLLTMLTGAANDTAQPPLHIEAIGTLTTNIFLSKIECVMIIEWQASALPVTAYHIYNGTTHIGTVLPKDPHVFWTHVNQQLCTQGFSITALLPDGTESEHVPVRVDT